MKSKPENPLPKTPMLKGSVCVQYRRCGKPNCRCQEGEPHGPYFFRFWRERGRLRKAYVPKLQLQHVLSACLAYQEQQARNRRTLQECRQQLKEMTRLVRQIEREAR